MKELLYFLIDLGNYAIQGCILVSLMQDLLQKRFHFRKKCLTECILWLQFVAVQLFLANAPVVKKLLYGEDMIMRNSGQSIWLILLSTGITLGFATVLYRGNRIGIAYLVVLFYALRELVRFTLYSFWIWLLDKAVNEYFYGLWEQGKIGTQRYLQYLSYTEIIWNLSLIVSTLLILRWCLRKYKSCLQMEDYRLETSEILFLAVPGVLGLSLGLMLRSILFSYRGNEMLTITAQHPEMNVMIPCMTLLCILSILASAVVFRRLSEEKEEKMKARLYRSRMNEMEKHLAEVEHLYDGIRGMKHDMRHYIADMEALLGQKGGDGEENRKELRNYLNSLKGTTDRLDIPFQTGNPITDVVLGRHARAAEKGRIPMEIAFAYPKNMGIDAFDLGIILNNGLENAIEACENVKPEERFVKVDSHRNGNMFFLTIENSFDGQRGNAEDDGLHGDE